MIPAIDIQQMQPAHLATLHQICCDAYSQNFHTHWHVGGLEQYINKVFGFNTLETELADTNIQYYVAFIDHQPVAFMKLNLFSNLPNLAMEKGLELDKIYILPQFKGMKIGRRLLEIAFETAKQNKKEICWLAVIDTNAEAISFYVKTGFRFHSRTRIDYPGFKEELKGMWRMYFELPVDIAAV